MIWHKSVVVAVFVVYVCAGAQITAAVPLHDTVTVPKVAVERESPSARFFNFNITTSTSTTTVIMTNFTTVFPTCTLTVSGVSACPTPRSLGFVNLPIDTSRAAQSDMTALLSKKQESDIEVEQLLWPSFADEPEGRQFGFSFVTKNITKSSTLTNTVFYTASTVTFIYGGCIPTDAPITTTCNGTVTEQ